MPECPNCETPFTGATCRDCGWTAPTRTPERKVRTTCDCGALLVSSGLCGASGGYPATASCPLACPICRGPLGWDGGCERCHGCTTGRREDWTFPGDRYALEKGHWQRVDGPRRACTPEENAAGFAAVRAILGGAEHLSATRSARGLPSIDPAIRARVTRSSADTVSRDTT